MCTNPLFVFSSCVALGRMKAEIPTKQDNVGLDICFKSGHFAYTSKIDIHNIVGNSNDRQTGFKRYLHKTLKINIYENVTAAHYHNSARRKTRFCICEYVEAEPCCK